MNKVSKILVMAVVVLAVVTMSLNVNASTQVLKDYVGGIHNINNMVFELTDSQKTVVLNYISTLDTETAGSIHADIIAAENLVKNSGATNVQAISKSVKTEVINLATSAAAKANLKLSVNTANNTFTLTKLSGEVLISGSADSLIKYNNGSAAGGAASSAPAATGSTLLYTGSDYAVYAVAALAIVAVALVVKKRA